MLIRLLACSALNDVSPLSKCVALKKLSLAGCSSIEHLNTKLHPGVLLPHTAAAFIQHCTGLTEVDLSGCRRLESLTELSGCSDLQVSPPRRDIHMLC